MSLKLTTTANNNFIDFIRLGHEDFSTKTVNTMTNETK